MWNVLLKSALTGLGQGLVASALGYLKQNEPFDNEKFFQTVAVGGIVGLIGGLMGLNYDDASTHLESIGAITLIEYAKKTIIRRFIPKVTGRGTEKEDR